MLIKVIGWKLTETGSRKRNRNRKKEGRKEGRKERKIERKERSRKMLID